MYMLEFIELIVSFFAVGIVGEQIHRNTFETDYSGFSRVFLNLFLGLFFLVSLFAAVKTNGVTINLIFVLLTIGAFVRNRWIKRNKFTFKVTIDKHFIYSSLPLILFFCWRLITIIQPDTDLPIVINMDSMKHVLRANFLNEFGIESINVNYLHPPTGVDPYHYFDPWTIALFGSVFRGNFWILEQLVVYPLYSTIIVCGFWGVIERFKAPFLVYILGILVVQFSGFYLNEFENHQYLAYSGGFRTNAFDDWKGFTVSIAYLVILLFINVVIRSKKVVESLGILMILPVVSITLLPATFSAVILCLTLLFILRKKWKLPFSMWIWWVPFGVLVYIVGFYQLFESTEVIIEKPSVINNLEKLFTYERLRLSLILVVEKIIQGSLYLAPVFIIAGIAFVRNKKRLLIIIKEQPFVRIWFLITILLLACGAFFWQLFYDFFGSSQFLFYSALPMLNCTALVLLCFSVRSAKSLIGKVSLLVGIAIMFIFFWQRSYDIFLEGKKELNDYYSHQYIETVLKLTGDKNHVNGFKLVNDKRIIKWDENDHLAGGFLVGYYNQVNLYNLNFANYYFSKEIKDSQAAMMLPFSGIISHARTLKNQNNLNVEDVVQDLIEHHEFRWIFVHKGEELPNYLKEIVQLKAIDALSGEQMYSIEEN